MSDHHFLVRCEPEHALIRIEVFGFWSGETVHAVNREYAAALRQLGARAREHVILLGFDDAEVAPAAVIDKLRDYIAKAPIKARRIACYTGSALKRLQVQRMVPQGIDARVFAEATEALAWALEWRGETTRR